MNISSKIQILTISKTGGILVINEYISAFSSPCSMGDTK